MEKEHYISHLRQVSRKLIRELGLLQLNNVQLGKTPSHWHALIEIDSQPGITVSEVSNLLLLSLSATSRIIESLLKNELVIYEEALDKRKKRLFITDKGKSEISQIDDFSHIRIKGALNYLNEQEQYQILKAIEKYADVLKLSREKKDEVKILKLSTSRLIRKKIIFMTEKIQKEELNIPITEGINASILKAEEYFHYNNECNFWYAINKDGEVIGSIGLRMIDKDNAEIKKFFVRQDYRGQGVAWQLFNKLVTAASKHKFRSLYGGVIDESKAAQRFFQKRGFKFISKSLLPKGFYICHSADIFLYGLTKDIEANLLL
jgi:DNA-binding MarR family transcriptional regulator/N-acetylglutamate synthase-like GNAT family acetyltransferase